MKKIISSILLGVLLMTSSVQKAEAGVVVLTGFAINEAVEDCEGWCLVIAVYGGVGITLAGLAIGGVTAIFNPHAGYNVMKIAAVLDANGKLPVNNLNNYFTERYDFIDNQETIRTLTKTIEREYKNGETEVRLSENTIRNLFQMHDLTKEQENLIMNDLR